MRRWLLVLLSFACAGCAVKRPVNVHYAGCKVTATWTDDQGNTRKDCDCRNGKQIGWDAKKGAAIVKCE